MELVRQLKADGVQAADYYAYADRFLEAKARKNLIPLCGTFELTPLCNLDCRMCYVHLTGAQFDRRSLLSAAQWQGLMRQARQAGMLYATLTGGECLTYPAFDELYLFLMRMGIRPTVLTNGALMDERRIDFFKSNPPRLIQVSVYGSTDDDYERVTGHRVCCAVFDHIALARDAGLPVRVAVTPNRFMYEDRRRLLEKVAALEVPYKINASLFLPRENTGRDLTDLTVDEYIDIYQIQRELKHRPKADPVDLAELPDESKTAERRAGLRCGAGRSAFTIQYNGAMSPCVSLEEIVTHPLETGFLTAWKQLNQAVGQYLIPGECAGCVYRKGCLQCPAMHRRAAPGHCDPAVCERTKRMNGAGLLPVPGAGESTT